jgi:hypothetical protein
MLQLRDQQQSNSRGPEHETVLNYHGFKQLTFFNGDPHMDIYHIWCDLKPGVKDLTFTEAANTYLSSLVNDDQLSGFRITRRKLGLGIPELGEFHLMLEFNDLAQLDEAFSHVAARTDPVESFHHSVNSLVSSVKFSLYRDFPDAHRQTGEEKF